MITSTAADVLAICGVKASEGPQFAKDMRITVDGFIDERNIYTGTMNKTSDSRGTDQACAVCRMWSVCPLIKHGGMAGERL